MTDLEALVSISQTAMRARGQWCVDGIDETLRRDIRAMVGDCAKLLGLSMDYSETLEGMAVRELERRATPGSIECPHCHWGFAPAVVDQHIREKHGEG